MLDDALIPENFYDVAVSFEVLEHTICPSRFLKKINNSLLVKNFFGKGNINNVWMSHSDQVYQLPKGFKVIASSKNSKLTIIENDKKKLYSVHPVCQSWDGRAIVGRTPPPSKLSRGVGVGGHPGPPHC